MNVQENMLREILKFHIEVHATSLGDGDGVGEDVVMMNTADV